MRPASTMKCVTAIAALYRLGSNYNYRTNIYYTGSIDDSTHVLNGDIYCVGGMDPLVSNADITTIAQAIKALNITKIRWQLSMPICRLKTEMNWAMAGVGTIRIQSFFHYF